MPLRDLPPLSVSAAEAAEMIGVGKTTLYELIAAGEIAALKIGGRQLVRCAELERFLLAREDAERGRKGEITGLVRRARAGGAR